MIIEVKNDKMLYYKEKLDKEKVNNGRSFIIGVSMIQHILLEKKNKGTSTVNIVTIFEVKLTTEQ